MDTGRFLWSFRLLALRSQAMISNGRSPIEDRARGGRSREGGVAGGECAAGIGGCARLVEISHLTMSACAASRQSQMARRLCYRDRRRRSFDTQEDVNVEWFSMKALGSATVGMPGIDHFDPFNQFVDIFFACSALASSEAAIAAFTQLDEPSESNPPTRFKFVAPALGPVVASGTPRFTAAATVRTSGSFP